MKRLIGALFLVLGTAGVSFGQGIITTVAGDGNRNFSGDGGLATVASISEPFDVFVDPSGDMYIADSRNNRIRKVDGSTGIITTIAGSGGTGPWNGGYGGDGGAATSATLNEPKGVAVDASGNVYIADYGRVCPTCVTWNLTNLGADDGHSIPDI